MAHLTCYHCHITCVSRITNSNLYRWSRPRTMPVVAGVAFNATTSDRILLNPFRSKCALKPCGTRAGGQFESQSYPLSINTRITRENCAKNNHNFNPPKQAPPNGLPQPFPHTRSPKQGIKTKPCLTGGWPHFVKPSTPHKFFNRWCRQSLNRNPKGDPHDLAFDEINSRRWHHAFNGL